MFYNPERIAILNDDSRYVRFATIYNLNDPRVIIPQSDTRIM